MDDGSPTLEVGFAINFGDAFGQLRTLDDIVGETAATVYREAQQMEKALGGGFGLSGSTAEIRSFGNAVTREMQAIKRETDQAEKSGEAMVRQMQRQVDVFGKSASEIRNMRAELRAVAAEERGLTELAARIRTLNGEMNRLEVGTGKVGTANRLARHDMLNLGYQINDVIVSLMGGQKPMTVFAQQGAQIGQIAASSGVGLRGMAASLVALAVPFLPIIALVGAAVGGFLLFDRAVSKGVDTKGMISSLGLTRDEIKKLENTTVTSGDVIKATFQVIAQRVGFDMGNVKQYFSDALDFMTKLGRLTLAGIYAEFVGTFRAVSAVVQAGFSGKGIDGMLAAAGEAYTGAFNEANGALKRFGTDVEKQIGSNKLKDLRKQANEIKLDRPDKTDKHAEQLLREAEAVEAQIRNLYQLADAYGVSGAAALVAEARVKAESAAIKGRADIEEMVERQIRLSIAERVKNAAAGAAAMRDEAAIQQQVNDSVRAGITPAAQAGELLRDRIADLSLLAAVEAAQQVSGQKGISATAAATRALDEQRTARVALTDAQKQASLLAARDGANESLALAKEELRLIGATDEARARALATMKATQEAARIGWGGKDAADYVKTMGDVAAQAVINAQAQDAYNASLTQTADEWDIIANKVASAARGMADAFGASGRAIGDVAAIFADYQAQRTRAEAVHNAEVTKAGNNQIKLAIENRRYALQSSGAQVAAYGDMVGAAKGFFKEGSKGYQALAAAEKVYRVAQFAMSLQAMIQNAAETLGFVANSTARSAAAGAEGIATQSKLPFPANIAAMAATAAALVAAGIAVVGGGGGAGGAYGRPVSNTGTGSVLGDPEAKSESIKNAIDALREVDLLQNSYSRQMAASLRSIDNQIGGVASLVARSGDINANAGVTEGFKMSGLGSALSKIPVIGGILGGLFGSKTTVVGSGLYGGAQSVGTILNGGFDAQYYSDVQKKKKLFGITTGTSYSTQFSGADANLENQFTLILKSFSDAIGLAAGPLGETTQDFQNRLNSFVVDIGRIDLQGLSGTEIQEKLSAVFGKAADGMANAAFPGLEKFQKVGEGLFETLVRVSSTAEAVTTALDQTAATAPQLSIAAKISLADQFDSIGDFTNAVGSYFEAFYSSEEQAAAKTAQFAKTFASLGVSMPSSLAAYRALVEAQNLNTEAGQATYATLLQLAPAFAELQEAMAGAKSAADIASERIDLQRQMLQLRGDTAAIRALDLAKLDPSNRALQQQIWDMQDAQDAAKTAQTLADAWKSVGDTIMTEIKRIRGLSDTAAGGGFAQLQGQFNAASIAARGGDQDAAKSLPGLSQALLTAASNAATSKQEYDRIRAQTAASLEATYGAVMALTKTASGGTSSSTLEASAAAAAAPRPANDTTDLRTELQALTDKLEQMRSENMTAQAAIAGNTGRIARTLDNVTLESGGNAIATAAAA